MFKLAIFDLDGTLIDSVHDLADATNRALTDLGLPTHEADKYYYFVGNGALKLCERALPEDMRTPENIKTLHCKFTEKYASCCLNKTVPYKGISAVLSALQDMGIKCAVASNKPDAFSVRIVRHFFGDCFDLTVGKRDGVPTKPDPQIVQYIMDALDAESSETVMIGDSSVDILTAKNSGTASIGCTWGFRSEDELVEAGGKYLAHEPADILKLISEMEAQNAPV